jgi:hypothetical protein
LNSWIWKAPLSAAKASSVTARSTSLCFTVTESGVSMKRQSFLWGEIGADPNQTRLGGQAYDSAGQPRAAVAGELRLPPGGTLSTPKVVFTDVQHHAAPQEVAEAGAGDDEGRPHGAFGIRHHVAQVAGVPHGSSSPPMLPSARVVVSAALLAAVAEVAQLVHVQAVPPGRHPVQADGDAHARPELREANGASHAVGVEGGHGSRRSRLTHLLKAVEESRH